GMMPVRMWIERRKQVKDGKTKEVQVVMVVPSLPKLRHALSGPISTAAALDPASLGRPAIEAAPSERPDYLADARECRTADDVRQVWRRANRAGHVAADGSDELSQDLMRIAADIAKGIDPSTGEIGDQGGHEPGPDDDGVYDVEVLGDDEPVGTEPPVAEPASVSWPQAAQPGQGARP